MTKNCFHCSDTCYTEIVYDNKCFCCNGCKTVYQILNDNNLENYYSINNKAGLKPENKKDKYFFLDNAELVSQLYDFKSDDFAKTTLYLPQIHCSSCVYLLENLYYLNKGIIKSEINFTKKIAFISFNPQKTSLKEIALLLEKIGYAPNFEKNDKKDTSKLDKSFYLKLGVAGFFWGNIMLLSFPEYFGVEMDFHNNMGLVFQLIILTLSIPIMLYPAMDYIVSAYKAIKSSTININIPISIGIVALYIKSVYDILILNNASYLDSFASFIFFLFIGKYFQNRTYDFLSFSRDYKSYFPLAITVISKNTEEILQIHEIKENDVLLIRNEDVIPCDAILLDNNANIDYSFVTGEAELKLVDKGQIIYAGGKLYGENKKLQVIKKVDQSYFTHLWNQSSFKKEEVYFSELSNKISKYFIIILLIISLLASFFWFFISPNKIVDIVVSILIVACPCALALAMPFTFGHAMRIFGLNSFYIKNINIIENLSNITDIVFDKTGTITYSDIIEVKYIGNIINDDLASKVVSASSNSKHLLSQNIKKHLNINSSIIKLKSFEEIIGQGIEAVFEDESVIQLGSAAFVNNQEELSVLKTSVYLKYNNELIGRFEFENKYRECLTDLIKSLKSLNYNIHLLTGDNENQKQILEEYFGQKYNLVFNQKPLDKLNYIKKVENKGGKVIMLGDGLNDAGALKASSCGICITDDIYNFSPSSDIIFDSKNLSKLPNYLIYSKKSIIILKICLVFSLLYNIVGLSIAITGSLTPLIAAILMPLSSITVVILSTILSVYYQKKLF